MRHLPTALAGLSAICLLLPASASAQTAPAEPSSSPTASNEPATDAQAPTTEATGTDKLITSTQQSVRSTVEWLASGIDGRFGDKPFSEGGKVTHGRIGLAFLKREGQSPNVGLRFNAKFHLPNLSNMPYIFVGNDNERDEITDQPDRHTLRDQIRQRNWTDNAFFAGIGAWLTDEVEVRLGFRGPRPYAQARWHQNWEVSPTDLVLFRQSFFYTVRDRAGSTSSVEYQHAFRPTTSVRWLNAATITQKNPHFAYKSILGLYESFGQERVLGLETQFTQSRVDSVTTDEFGLQARWEQPLHRNVLGEVSLGHFWPRSSDVLKTEGVWAFGAVVTLKF